MSKEIKILLPKLGESIVVATVVKWLKNVDDLVKKDEALLEVSTDKVNSEIPSPVSGRVKEILKIENEEVQIGEVLAIIESEDNEIEIEKPIISSEKHEETKSKASFFSPVVLRLAKEYNISFSDLEKITGTGEGGRITKKDIENYKSSSSNVITPIRKAIIQNITKSYKEIPHASIIDGVDVTDILALIKDKKESFFEKNNCKLTITSFICSAISKAIKLYPLVNSKFLENSVAMNDNINIGIAVSVKDAVVVPVIKNIVDLGIDEISKNIADLAKKARMEELTIEDTKNGNFTLTNFGMTGVEIGFPIIRYGEVAIIGIGAIKKKAVVYDDQICIRSIMKLILSFDHRVFDGMYACNFLNEIKSYLENANQISF